MRDLEIVTVDPHDHAALELWHRVGSDAVLPERPFALLESLPALRSSVQQPSPRRRRVLLLARRGEAAAGIAEVTFELADNRHLATLDIQVLASQRRQGVGTALLEAADRLRRVEGRTTVLAELYLPTGADDVPGREFAARAGFLSVHTEEHLAMRLPEDPVKTEALTRPAPGYEIVTWQGPCPDELRPGYVVMRNQMNRDVPTGDVDARPTVLDEERLRLDEERRTRAYHSVVAAARRASDGAMGGYSLVLLDRTNDVAMQDDTLVMPDHRGHGLGMQLKLATLAVIRSQHPERTTLHTWTDPTNAAMYRTNVAFGYAPVELMHEMQRID